MCARPHACRCTAAVQVCWLFLLPTVCVALMEARARRAFALRLPAGVLPRSEREWWLGVNLPPPCLVALVFLGPLSLAMWRLGLLALEAAS